MRAFLKFLFLLVAVATMTVSCRPDDPLFEHNPYMNAPSIGMLGDEGTVGGEHPRPGDTPECTTRDTFELINANGDHFDNRYPQAFGSLEVVNDPTTFFLWFTAGRDWFWISAATHAGSVSSIPIVNGVPDLNNFTFADTIVYPEANLIAVLVNHATNPFKPATFCFTGELARLTGFFGGIDPNSINRIYVDAVPIPNTTEGTYFQYQFINCGVDTVICEGPVDPCFCCGGINEINFSINKVHGSGPFTVNAYDNGNNTLLQSWQGIGSGVGMRLSAAPGQALPASARIEVVGVGVTTVDMTCSEIILGLNDNLILITQQTDSQGNTCDQCSGLNDNPTITLPGTCTGVYPGFSPLNCANLDAPSGTSYSWSTGETTQSIQVCPTGTSTYQVTVTDADGGSVIQPYTVNTYDAACGNNGNKVSVCHIPPGNPGNAHTICISTNALPAHVADFRTGNPRQGHDSGCHLGPCSSDPCAGFDPGPVPDPTPGTGDPVYFSCPQ